MDSWTECKLGDVVTFQRGHDITQSEFIEGQYPVAGSNGIINFHNKYTTIGPGVTVGRSGNSIGVAHYYENNFWAHNTTLYIKDFKDSYPKYIYYLLKTIDFKIFDTGSAVPSLNRNHINLLNVLVPNPYQQKTIASILSSLDDKIDLLHRQNKTLEAMAETLFRQWFVEEAEESWEMGKVKDLFILQRGYDLPLQNRNIGDYPIISSSGMNGFHDQSKVAGPGIVTGRSGVIGNVFYVREDFWPLNTSLYIKEFKIGKPFFAYFFLRSMDLKSLNGGSAVPTLNRNDVHDIEALIPPQSLVDLFESKAEVLFEKRELNMKQIKTVSSLRDNLLPRLLGGELHVNELTDSLT